MTPPERLATLLAPDVPLRQVEPGLFSVMPEGRAGAPYDGRAVVYDLLIGSKLYSRFMWGLTPDRYGAFIRRALESAQGPCLDVAAGSCLESAAAYPDCKETVVVLDLSLDMLRRGMRRLSKHGAAEHVVFLQADTTALPFRDAAFDTLLCHGAFHVFPDVDPICREWRRALAPSGRLHVSSLISAGRRGDRLLARLERMGELGTVRSADAFEASVGAHFPGPGQLEQRGNFAFLSLEPQEA